MSLENSSKSLTDTRAPDLEVKVIKKIIKKDLEIFNWMNWAYRRFGDFQFYSDYKLELNCFDQGLSLLVGREIKYGEDSLESYATDKCIEYLFRYVMDKKTEVIDTEVLADKFTSYLLDVSCVCLHDEMLDKRKNLDDLFKKYFPEIEPMVWTAWNSTILKHSSNNAC